MDFDDNLFGDIQPSDDNTASNMQEQYDPLAGGNTGSNTRNAIMERARKKGFVGGLKEKLAGLLRRDKKALAIPPRPPRPVPRPATDDIRESIERQRADDLKQYIPTETPPSPETPSGILQKEPEQFQQPLLKPTPVKKDRLAFLKNAVRSWYARALVIFISALCIATGAMCIYNELPTHPILVEGMMLVCFGSAAMFHRIDS